MVHGFPPHFLATLGSQALNVWGREPEADRPLDLDFDGRLGEVLSAWRGLPLTRRGNFFQVRSMSFKRSSRTSREWLTRWPWPSCSIIFVRCGACSFHSS